MPLFDKSQCPADTTDTLLDTVNEVIDRLRTKLVRQIVVPEPPLGIRVPNLARAYLQAHLRRMLAFLDGGHAEYVAGRPLMTEMATRAIYENVANVCDFTEKLKHIILTGTYDDIEKHVTSAAFTTRIPSFLEKHGPSVKAPQILNLIDRMNNKYPQYRQAYDHLSDIVHPNGLGAVVYFSTMDEGVVTFADGAVNPQRAMHSLFLAAIFLAFVEIEMDEVDAQLKRFSVVLSAAEAVLNRQDDEAPK
jgi:hypothetical protein